MSAEWLIIPLYRKKIEIYTVFDFFSYKLLYHWSLVFRRLRYFSNVSIEYTSLFLLPYWYLMFQPKAFFTLEITASHHVIIWGTIIFWPQLSSTLQCFHHALRFKQIQTPFLTSSRSSFNFFFLCATTISTFASLCAVYIMKIIDGSETNSIWSNQYLVWKIQPRIRSDEAVTILCCVGKTYQCNRTIFVEADIFTTRRQSVTCERSLSITPYGTYVKYTQGLLMACRLVRNCLEPRLRFDWG